VEDSTASPLEVGGEDEPPEGAASGAQIEAGRRS
jgi:hypothetical protein